MRVVRYSSASAFLDAVGGHLLESEAENALILGVAYTLAARTQALTSAPYFAAVFDGSDPAMMAFSNHAERLGVTRASNPAAIAALARDVADACPAVRDVGGPEPSAGMFAAAMAAERGQGVERRMGTRIHQLDVVRPPGRPPAGHLRQATEADVPMVAPWVEILTRMTADSRSGPEIAHERVRMGQLYIWDDDGPVSMAAWTGKTPNGVRVNLVVTPEERRGRGYASGAVAALSQQLLDAGNRFCTLYTDVANPTSNAIYARIGYRPVCDAAVYTIVGGNLVAPGFQR